MTNQTYRLARHNVSLLHAHLVFLTKYRPRVFTNATLTHGENTMPSVCNEPDAELVEFNGEADPLHLLVAYPPTLAISVLVQRPESTRACVRARRRGHLWSPSYFAVSRGAHLSIFKQYIDGQARPL